MASRLTRGASLAALAVALVATWEGVRTIAYRDSLAGGIPTICFGETRGVKMGDRYTLEECKVMLGEGLVEFEAMIRPCLSDPDKIPDPTYAAILSLSYNIGARAFCRSTVARRLNAGDIRGACDAMLLWNRAGGRVVRGLVNRRKAERELCLKGA